MKTWKAEKLLTVEPELKPQKCDLCDEVFEKPRLLKKHIKAVHEEKYEKGKPRPKVHKCETCQKSFSRYVFK